MAEVEVKQPSMLELAQQRLSDAYCKHINCDLKAIDPATISIIIDIALQVLKACLPVHSNSMAAVKTASGLPVLARLRLRQVMRASPDYFRRTDREAIIETLIETANASKVDELQGFLQEADFNV